MKKLFTLSLLSLAASSAFALAPLDEQKIQNIVNHCKCVMSGGICIVETRRPLATSPEQISSYGLVSVADANYLTLAGDNMCAAAETELRKDSTSARSAVARARWRQSFTGPCLPK